MNRNCPENANRNLVKSHREMGIQLGECRAQNKCLEEEKQKDSIKIKQLQDTVKSLQVLNLVSGLVLSSKRPIF